MFTSVKNVVVNNKYKTMTYIVYNTTAELPRIKDYNLCLHVRMISIEQSVWVADICVTKNSQSHCCVTDSVADVLVCPTEKVTRSVLPVLCLPGAQIDRAARRFHWWEDWTLHWHTICSLILRHWRNWSDRNNTWHFHFPRLFFIPWYVTCQVWWKQN